MASRYEAMCGRTCWAIWWARRIGAARSIEGLDCEPLVAGRDNADGLVLFARSACAMGDLRGRVRPCKVLQAPCGADMFTLNEYYEEVNNIR